MKFKLIHFLLFGFSILCILSGIFYNVSVFAIAKEHSVKVNSPQQILTAARKEAINDVVIDNPDSKIFKGIVEKVSQSTFSTTEISPIVQQVALNLLGAKYQAGLLDNSPTETLIVSLEKFDCVLFIETAIAIARSIYTQDYDYYNFTQKVAEQRYLDGKMTDYCSRLHYFSHWLMDNEKRGLIANITTELGGIRTIKQLNFMTSHRSSYPQLKNNETNYQCIATMEKQFAKFKFNYLPTAQINKVYNQLKPGDIVGIATKISGLDFTHTGLIYRGDRGDIGLIHASPAGQVVIAPDLQSYVQNVSRAMGIVIARPQASINN